MVDNTIRKFIIIVLFLFCGSQVFAHPGGLDATGGHHNRKTGEYHCHRCPCGCVDTIKTSEAPLKVERSSEARNAFMQQNPCPTTGKTYGPCPGYIIDHIVPLKRGGDDSPTNMQWQTKEDAKAKDKIE